MAPVIEAAAGEETTATAQGILVPVGWVVGAVLVALGVAVLIGAIARIAAKKSMIAADLARRSKRPLRAVLVVIAVGIALHASVPDETWESTGWWGAIGHVLLIALIAAATWLVGTLAFVVEDAALSRYRVDVKDNRHARRVRTQIQLLRRITVAVLVVVAVAAVLLSFPGVSAFGASLLASAGVLSIVAGLAAQSSLANVFAGLQLAFTDAIRVDDVVIVEQEWGRIEEITLTYVVVHVWDDRRLILPSTYFTQTPFENWTRRAAELLGTVEIDVDWQVPVDDLRGELNRLLADTDLWDQRVGVLQVTDAVNGVVRLRALASAVDAPTLFDLRCYLREGLVAYLQSSAPQGLPRTRIETTQGTAPHARPLHPAVRDAGTGSGGHDGVEPRPDTGPQDARLFSGSLAATERSRSFAGPGQDVIDEREEHAASVRAEAEATLGVTSDATPGATDEVSARTGATATATVGTVGSTTAVPGTPALDTPTTDQPASTPIPVPGRAAPAAPPSTGQGASLAETQQLSTGDPGTMVLPSYPDGQPDSDAPPLDAERPAEPTEAHPVIPDEPPVPRARRSVRSAPIDPSDANRRR